MSRDGTVIYTGPLDELFGCRFGRLPYRSLDFDFETVAVDQYQPRATINYTVSEDYTLAERRLSTMSWQRTWVEMDALLQDAAVRKLSRGDRGR